MHRLRALVLLGRFLDMGRWAVDLALSVGIFPYVLKLLQTTAPDLRQTLVFIWTKILALDRSCQVSNPRIVLWSTFSCDDDLCAREYMRQMCASSPTSCTCARCVLLHQPAVHAPDVCFFTNQLYMRQMSLNFFFKVRCFRSYQACHGLPSKVLGLPFEAVLPFAASSTCMQFMKHASGKYRQVYKVLCGHDCSRLQAAELIVGQQGVACCDA